MKVIIIEDSYLNSIKIITELENFSILPISSITFFIPEKERRHFKNLNYKYYIKEFVSPKLGLKDIALVIESSYHHDLLILGPYLGELEDTKRAITYLFKHVKIPILIADINLKSAFGNYFKLQPNKA